MDNIKYIYHDIDKQCMLRYHTNINKYNEYWYNDMRYILNNYNFVLIDSFSIPIETGNTVGIELLKNFCELMTVGNRVVIFDNEEFIRYINAVGSNAYYDTCITVLDELLTTVGFECIHVYEHSYLYKDVYIYTKSKPGLKVYEEIEDYYGNDVEAKYVF